MPIIVPKKKILKDDDILDIFRIFYGGRNKKISDYLREKGCCGEKVKVRYKDGMIKVSINNPEYSGLVRKIKNL